MPNYGIAQSGGAVTDLGVGESLTLFNAESPTAPQASIAFARRMSPSGADQGITFSIAFAAAAVTAAVLIQGANQDVDAQYQTLLTSTNKQFDLLTDTGRWAYYRAKLSTYAAGGALTVIAQR